MDVPCCSSTTEEEDQVGEVGEVRSPLNCGAPELKCCRADGNQPTAPTHQDRLPAGGVPDPDQQGAAEHCRDDHSAELQSVCSLTVTIQQRNNNREFGQTERRVGQFCHVCKINCESLQVFQDHMSGPDHLRNLQEVTRCISQNSGVLQHRGRSLHTQHWCDVCHSHFSGNVIVHRRTPQHKVCKLRSRPFCPVCRRYFRTPRKFVEHMKSVEHKQQVQQDDAQEDELITVDAVGCFEGEQPGRGGNRT